MVSSILGRFSLIFISVWLFLIPLAVFIIFGLGYLRFDPSSSGEVASYLEESKSILIFLSIFSLINSLLMFTGIVSDKFSKFLLRADIVIVILSVLIIGLAYVIPCEGLECIGNGIMLLIGIIAISSVLLHAPIFYLVLHGANRSLLNLIVVGFASAMIITPLTTYSYSQKTSTKKAEFGVSQGQKELGIVIFRPTYLPPNGKLVNEGRDNVADLNSYMIF